MKRSLLLALLVGAIALVALPALGAQGANSHANYRAVCPNPPAGYAHCHELVVTDSHGNPLASSSPTGLSPATIRSVYGFPTGSTAGAGTTIAIVDAYDDPKAASDLDAFSSQYNLPSASFTKVDQTGGTNYPHANSGWALEISLDIEWAHAVAPGAHILLVEASSNRFTDLLAAEDYAAAHADYVSNSWGGTEFSGESSYDSHFSASGVSFFVSAGDSGLPAEYPSASPDVISVGGTTLTQSASGSWSETGWSGGGGGCSAYETATGAQANFPTYGQVGCNGARATPDVSLDADPNSGVAVYDSVKYQGQQGWFQVGGTSASSPMWAAASADSGKVVDSGYVYGNNNMTFNDVTVGNNGASCLVGYDLCSGRGSWIYSSSSALAGGSSGGGGSTQPMGVSISAGTISTKGSNYWVPLSVSATDSSSSTGVAGASVQLDVYQGTCGSGSVAASGSGTTDGSGQAAFKFHTKATGGWCAEATVTASGYSTGTGEQAFSTP